MTTIRQKLSELRRLIRLYVLLDGSAKAIGVAAWLIGLMILLDFLPTRLGLSEFSLATRTSWLLSCLAIFGFLFYRFALGRACRPISDSSIRLLIERARPELADRLLTTGLNMESPDGPWSPRQQEMLQRLEVDIDAVVQSCRARDLLAFRPLLGSLTFAVVPLTLLVALVTLYPEIGWPGVRRNLFLSTETYPRRTEITEVRFRRLPANPRLREWLAGNSQNVLETQSLPISAGDSIALEVVSRCPEAEDFSPREATLIYRLDNGQRGQLTLPRVRLMPDGRAVFTSDQGILKAMEVSGDCWIRVDDATWGPARLDVKSPPLLKSIQQLVTYPSYLTASSIFENGPVDFVNGAPFPAGTRIEFQLEFDRDRLAQVFLWDEATGQPLGDVDLRIDGGSLQFQTKVTEDTTWSLAVEDTSGRITSEPIRLAFQAIEDRPPMINVTPVGVGMAVTRNARIPLQIEGDDEFGIRNGQILVTLPALQRSYPLKFSWAVARQKVVDVDLLELRREGHLKMPSDETTEPLVIQVATSLADHHPEHAPAEGQVFDFEIVDEKRLVQIIEQQEAALRQRVEEVSREFESCRVLILSAIEELESAGASSEPFPTSIEEAVPVYIQRVRLQTQKSSREIAGIAEALKGLIDQLENNRLRIKTKQLELAAQVEAPLREFAENGLSRFQTDLVQWNEQLRQVLASADDSELAALLPQSRQVLDTHAELLRALNRIIQQMVKFESQSELLDSVRALIDEHQAIMKATEQELERKLFEGILD